MPKLDASNLTINSVYDVTLSSVGVLETAKKLDACVFADIKNRLFGSSQANARLLARELLRKC